MKTNDDADLAEASPGDVDNRGLTLHSGILEPSLNEQHVIDAVGFLKQYLLRDEGPEFVQVDSGLVEVGVVGVHVEVPHANLHISIKKSAVQICTSNKYSTVGDIIPKIS